ncbi:hypothetical protein RJD39_18305 [Vibrio scophthalmi]|uniref:Uncharacterized protein n=1 Tax=Vibrio scophthalmi TaxID=45658 RepID=A0A1E3WHN4_9VIBR|nr:MULTISPECIES: hypothetical protein [Vibrio]EGU34330.1 hypothetical protein VIBRN418_06066 [Vibrio sp. N418]MCY9804526.1 hypothetical protein [Vibrio scophthalmi]ODS05325.1 hypothetical protein VSF3289_04466 [Vibrio scophthalmi]
MNLHSCTIVLRDHSKHICKTVEQSLGVIDSHGVTNIDAIEIQTLEGPTIHYYQTLSIEESIESLMNL